jgi:hypothetical protein
MPDTKLRPPGLELTETETAILRFALEKSRSEKYADSLAPNAGAL